MWWVVGEDLWDVEERGGGLLLGWSGMVWERLMLGAVMGLRIWMLCGNENTVAGIFAGRP